MKDINKYEDNYKDFYFKEGCKYIYPELINGWKDVVESLDLPKDYQITILETYVNVFKLLDEDDNLENAMNAYYSLYDTDFKKIYKDESFTNRYLKAIEIQNTIFKNIVFLSKRGVEVYLYDSKISSVKELNKVSIKNKLMDLNNRNKELKQIHKKDKIKRLG